MSVHIQMSHKQDLFYNEKAISSSVLKARNSIAVIPLVRASVREDTSWILLLFKQPSKERERIRIEQTTRCLTRP